MMSERHKYKPVAVRDTFEELTEDDLNVLSIGGRLRRRRIDAEGAAEVEIDSDDPEGDLDDDEKEELIKDWGFFRIARFLITCVLAGLSFIFFVDFLVKRAPASWTEPYEPGNEKFRDRIESRVLTCMIRTGHHLLTRVTGHKYTVIEGVTHNVTKKKKKPQIGAMHG